MEVSLVHASRGFHGFGLVRTDVLARGLSQCVASEYKPEDTEQKVLWDQTVLGTPYLESSLENLESGLDCRAIFQCFAAFFFRAVVCTR